jgi:hypothetical protein
MKKITITHTRNWRGLPLPEKLTSLTRKSDGCWIWEGAKQQHGYGTLPHDGVRIYAHRASYEVTNGPIPDGMRVDHMCHEPACVRPDHLRLVTIKQNAENFSGLKSTNKSGYRGVHWHAETKKWNVQVTHNGRRYAGGLHTNIEDANAAAIALRNKLHTHNDLDRAA